nr:MAG TPA: hypothetical protein [Caudoviricetes sp.]
MKKHNAVHLLRQDTECLKLRMNAYNASFIKLKNS